MKTARFNKSTYRYIIHEKSHGMTETFAIMASIFYVVFWVKYVLPFVIDAFGGKLLHRFVENGVKYTEPTGTGFFVAVWYVAVIIVLFFAVYVYVGTHLLLKECQRTDQTSWKETLLGLIHFDEGYFNQYTLSKIFLLTTLAIPLIYSFPIPFGNGTKTLGLYFLSFIFISTYGFRFRPIERHEKRMKKREEKLAKKEKEKEMKEKQKEMAMPPAPVQIDFKTELQNTLQSSIHSEQYQLNYFQEEINEVIQEIQLFIRHREEIHVEDYHMIKRILKEEIPAVNLAYDKLDAGGRKEYAPKLQECLTKIISELQTRNEGQMDIEKIEAEKLVEIINQRY